MHIVKENDFLRVIPSLVNKVCFSKLFFHPPRPIPNKLATYLCQTTSHHVGIYMQTKRNAFLCSTSW